MALHLLRSLADSEAGCLRAEPVPALYLNGYDFGDRALEDIAFRITVTGGVLAARMMIAEDLRRSLRIDRAEAEADAVAHALQEEVFSTSPALADDAGRLYDDAKPLAEQAFVADPAFTIVSGPA